MTQEAQNPIGLQGFEFVEFSAPDPKLLEQVMTALGFTKVAQHRSKKTALYRQGDINFILNEQPRSQAEFFAAEHGPAACAMAFRVQDAHHAYDELLRRGAEPMELPTGPMELRLPAIKGIGGAPIFLIDRFGDQATIYDIDFKYLDGVDRNPVGAGLKTIDHLTHNVYKGRMGYWASFYERFFNFKEIRYFDIKGEYTGLHSKAMAAPDGLIRIPLNEEATEGKGQIQEFLDDFNGEGIQHIALSTDDIYATVDRLRALGIDFMKPPPATYYDMLEERLPGHGEPVDEMKARGLLVDGSTEDGDPRILLQIFTKPLLGPAFFEIIQRKHDEGFGEGNFKALFESIERDQVQRGVIAAKA